MKRVVLFLLMIVFVAGWGCSPHKIQNRHKKHSRKYNKRMTKQRSKQYRRLKGRASINQRSHNKKQIIKKYGGTYIIR